MAVGAGVTISDTKKEWNKHGVVGAPWTSFVMSSELKN